VYQADREPISWADHPEYDRALLGLKDQGARGGLKVKGRSFSDIAMLMNRRFGADIFTKDSIQKRWAVLTPPTHPLMPAPEHTPYYSTYFDPYGNLHTRAPEKLDWRGYAEDLFSNPEREVKTLVISDQQGIYCNEDLLRQVMTAEHDPDIVVFPGDVCDWEGASKYPHERDFPLVHEADWFVRILESTHKRWPGVPVIITGSNHRRRIENSIRTLPQGLLFLAEQNPEKYLAQPFANVHAIDEWWVQIGDVIYAHKEGATTLAGQNARDAIDTFINWELSKQFGIKPFSVVVTGHSHKLVKLVYKSKLGIEPGSLASMPMPYMTSAKTKVVQDNGYAFVTQRAGRAHWNECGFVAL
jgi:predicted phosphodiesterase